MSDIEILKQTPEFKEFGYTIVRCPICGKPTLDTCWLCSNCGWEYDMCATINEQYSYPNGSTVNEYRNNFQKKLKLEGK